MGVGYETQHFDVNIISNWGEVFQMPLIIYTAFILPFFFQKKFGIIIMKHHKKIKQKKYPTASQVCFFQPSIHVSLWQNNCG